MIPLVTLVGITPYSNPARRSLAYLAGAQLRWAVIGQVGGHRDLMGGRDTLKLLGEWPLASRVQDTENPHGITRHVIDQYVITVRDQLLRACDTTGTAEVGMIGQPLGFL